MVEDNSCNGGNRNGYSSYRGCNDYNGYTMNQEGYGDVIQIELTRIHENKQEPTRDEKDEGWL